MKQNLADSYPPVTRELLFVWTNASEMIYVFFLKAGESLSELVILH